MSDGENPEYPYAVDASDRLESVSEPWLAFACANGAPELTRDALLGRSLWNFIADTQTCHLYQLLFERVRLDGAPRSVPFRCDSPDAFRFMELRMSPQTDDGIDLRGVLLRHEPRRRLPLLDLALPKARYHYPMCSFCKRLFVFGEWMEPESAVARLGMFETAQAPALDYEVCPHCAQLGSQDVRGGAGL